MNFDSKLHSTHYNLLAKTSLSAIPDEIIFLNSCINFRSAAKHQWNTYWSLFQIYLYVTHIWQNITSEALQSFSYDKICISSTVYSSYSVPSQVTNCQKVRGVSAWSGLHAPFTIKNKAITVLGSRLSSFRLQGYPLPLQSWHVEREAQLDPR